MNPKPHPIAENSPEPAKVLAFRRRRTTRAWTDRETTFVLGNFTTTFVDDLALAINRSVVAVEEFLRERGKAPLRRPTGLKRGRRASPGFVRTDDDAHVAAIFRERPQGFAW